MKVRTGPARTGAVIYNESDSQDVFSLSLLPSLRCIIPFEPTACKLVCLLCWLCRTVRRIKYSSASTEPRTQTTKSTDVPFWNTPWTIAPLSLYGHVAGFFTGNSRDFTFLFSIKNPITWPYMVRGGYHSWGPNGHFTPAQNKPLECGGHRWESPSELNIKSYWIYRREFIVYQLNSIPYIKQMKQRSSILVFPKCFHLILKRVLGRNWGWGGRCTPPEQTGRHRRPPPPPPRRILQRTELRNHHFVTSHITEPAWT